MKSCSSTLALIGMVDDGLDVNALRMGPRARWVAAGKLFKYLTNIRIGLLFFRLFLFPKSVVVADPPLLKANGW